MSFQNKILLIALVVFLLPISLYAADNSIRIKLVVSGMEDIENIIANDIKKEFLTLSDVVIVENDSDFLISIVAGEIRFVGGREVGVALSIALIENFDNSFLADMVQADKKSLIQSETSDLSKFKGHWFQVGPYKNIQKICTEIVKDINVHHLEGKREGYQNIKKE